MKVTWTVSDGYVGNGTHTTVVEDSYLIGLNEHEKMEEIEAWVEEDFKNLSFTITHINGNKV